jgi:hypothetical protein
MSVDRLDGHCGQWLCWDPAAWSYVWPGRWPGRPRDVICQKHFAELLQASASLGLSRESLDLRPIEEPEGGR